MRPKPLRAPKTYAYIIALETGDLCEAILWELCFADVLLMEVILHRLGCKHPVINNGINYQPQLVSWISSINSTILCLNSSKA